MTYDRSKLIAAPWEGWRNDFPACLLPNKSFKQITGWLLNKGRIQTFPALNAFAGAPNGEVAQGAKTFTDTLGFQHTLWLTKDRAYFLNNTTVFTDLGALPITSSEPFSMLTYLNRCFFTNGVGFLRYADGSAVTNVAGNVPGSCFFLGKLASSLFELNLVEGTQQLPLSIRWCGINSPNQWDATVDPTAGSAIIPEVEDQITGAAMSHNKIVAYRSKGISIISSTGTFPRFTVDNFETGDSGIGVNYPYSLASYGDISVFAAEDDFYIFALSNPEAIGGKAKKSIFNDLFSASDTPWACLVGSLGSGIDYKSYWLAIPQSNNTTTSMWIFHFDDQSWVNEQLPFGKTVWMGNVAVS